MSSAPEGFYLIIHVQRAGGPKLAQLKRPRNVCSLCAGREIDMVVSGSEAARIASRRGGRSVRKN